MAAIVARRRLERGVHAGAAVRFEPRQKRDVTLVPLGGRRDIYGFRQTVMGKV